MTRLLGVELRRVASRRLVLALMVLPLAFVALALVGIHLDLSMAEANRAEGERFYEQALVDWEENGAQMVADCREVQEQERELSGDPSLDFGCDQMREPVLEDFVFEPPPVREQLVNAVAALGVPVAVLAMLIGATTTAAEFSARTVGTWLTFEPRRDRVWGSKTLAATVGVLPMVVAVLAALAVGIPLVYRLNDDPATLAGGAWGEVAATGGRAVVLAMLAAALGAGLGMLLRNTGAVLGVLVAYAVVVEGLLQGFVPRVHAYLLARNAEAWLRGGLEWTDLECSPSPDGGQECVEVVRTVSLLDAGLLLGGVMAVVLVLSWLHFRRSDID
jgi:ABC-2 type transport system permease protein